MRRYFIFITGQLRELSRKPTIRNILLVGLISLFVRIVAFYKDIVVTNNLGLSELLDTFFIAILIPGLINGIFLSAFQSVFIPNYILELKRGNKTDSFLSSCLAITMGVSLLFLLIAILFTDTYLETFFPGHTANYYDLIITQFYYLAPCIILWGLTSLLNGLLTIYDEFTFTSLNGLLTPVSIIICVVFFGNELGSKVLVIGTLIGSFLNLLLMVIISANRGLLKFGPLDFKSNGIILLLKQVPAKISASLFSGVNPLVDQYFSAQLVVGSIAALAYGEKIPMFAIGILGMAMGKVLLPYFSKQASANLRNSFTELNSILKRILIGSTIITILLIILSEPIIRILFERNEFKPEDTIVVGKIMQMYLLQVPSYLCGLIMVKYLTSINRNSFMAFASLLNLLLNIGLNIILIEKFGVYGLALATSLVSIINSILLFTYIQKIRPAHV